MGRQVNEYAAFFNAMMQGRLIAFETFRKKCEQLGELIHLNAFATFYLFYFQIKSRPS